MELPTYTNIWKIEKRLYKLYDFRLPMPLPIGQVTVFLAIAVPYMLILTLAGMPFSHTWVWLYVLPPGVLAWLVTRPVLEGKRLPELVLSQLRYFAEPRTWCRMTPVAEKDHVIVVAQVWRAPASLDIPELAADPAPAASPQPAPVASPQRGPVASPQRAPARPAWPDRPAVSSPRSAPAATAAADSVVPASAEIPPPAATVAGSNAVMARTTVRRPALGRAAAVTDSAAGATASTARAAVLGAAGAVSAAGAAVPAVPTAGAEVPEPRAVPTAGAAVPEPGAAAPVPAGTVPTAAATVPKPDAARAAGDGTRVGAKGGAAAYSPGTRCSPPGERPGEHPAVTVRSGSAAERPLNVVERALRSSRADTGPGWRDRVVVVPGGHRPGKPDHVQRDQARARLLLPGPVRIVVLGSTAGAGQTVTALLTGQLLASLRGEAVAVLDLSAGPGSVTELARQIPRLLPGRQTEAGTDRGRHGGAARERALQVVTAEHTGSGPRDADRLIDAVCARYPLTIADPPAADVPRALQAADQLVLVSPASPDAAGSLAMTLEWLEAHGHARLVQGSVTVLNGVSAQTAAHAERTAGVAVGRCRAVVRVPWDGRLSGGGALGAETVRAFTALAGVLISGVAESRPGDVAVAGTPPGAAGR